jgi:hypothetical protein
MKFHVSLKDRIKQNITPRALGRRMLIGALIGLIVICYFVFSVDRPNPAWPQYWRIRPLLVAPLAGAFGILSFYLKFIIPPKNSLMNVLVIFISVLAFMIALWMGTVLGLSGTMWN